MTPSLKTEKGVSSCGGRAVSPIIGRFCGYFTSGRSPLSNGIVTVSAMALNEENIVWDPSAAMVAADPVIRRRLSIMAFSYWTSSPFWRSEVAFAPVLASGQEASDQKQNCQHRRAPPARKRYLQARERE